MDVLFNVKSMKLRLFFPEGAEIHFLKVSYVIE